MPNHQHLLTSMGCVNILLCPPQFSILTEAPAFQFQSSLLARVPVNMVMNASMVLLALRLACYALLPFSPTVWAVLPVELLHGGFSRVNPVRWLPWLCWSAIEPSPSSAGLVGHQQYHHRWVDYSRW